MKTARSIPAILFMLILLSVTTGMRPLAPESPDATIVVNTTLDEYNTSPNGTCSLREAIESANTNASFGGCTYTAGPGMDTITFQEGVQVYQISIPAAAHNNASGDLNITDSLIIQGYGPQFTVIDAGYQTITPSRFFDIDSTPTDISVVIQDVLLQNGNSDTLGGGAIYDYETLLLDNVVIQDSHTDGSGGAVCVIGNNTMVTIQDSTFSGNTSSGAGGAISANQSTLLIDNSSFLYNTAGYGSGDNGGAISA